MHPLVVGSRCPHKEACEHDEQATGYRVPGTGRSARGIFSGRTARRLCGQFAWAVVTASGLGCSAVVPSPPVSGTQALYRLEVTRSNETFSGRLVLRELGSSWEVEVADALGRSVWAWRVRGGRSAWIDANARSWCPDWRGELLALPRGFAVESLRAVLRGRLPDPALEPLEDGMFEIEHRGARWEGERVDGVVVRWSYTRLGGARTWSWRGDPRRGELVSSDGLTMQWRRIVIESLAAGSLDTPLVPEGYRRDCRELVDP